VELRKKNDHGIILNTSLNMAGEPIVNKPEEAITVFNNSDLDALFINDIMIIKNNVCASLWTAPVREVLPVTNS
jgi:predicted NodU family carbamoyl transferase